MHQLVMCRYCILFAFVFSVLVRPSDKKQNSIFKIEIDEQYLNDNSEGPLQDKIFDQQSVEPH